MKSIIVEVVLAPLKEVLKFRLTNNCEHEVTFFNQDITIWKEVTKCDECE